MLIPLLFKTRMNAFPQAVALGAKATSPLLCARELEVRLPVNGGPFSGEAIRAASVQMCSELEVATLAAQLKASQMASVELFCLLAQHAPEVLPASWALVYDIVASEERFWVYPKLTLGQIEDGDDEAFTPYLSRSRLANEWQALLAHVQRVACAQQSAKEHALTA